MKYFQKTTAFFLLILSAALFFGCKKDDEKIEPTLTPGEILASTPWETTGAKDNKQKDVALTDAGVANFVGFAYFKTDGTFTMYNLDDTPKMQGDWSVSDDGKTRTIVARNAATGAVLFTRVVDITVLTREEFTYRIYPDNSDKSVYYDIIHTPTSHNEPQK